MNNSYPVFRVQIARFKSEKGMLVFYCISIAIIGIMVPIFLQGLESSLTMAALLTAMFLKPMLSDSLAGEREHRTLETLLSSPMKGKSIIWRKFQFCLLFAMCYFTITAFCSALTCFLAGYEMMLITWQWICLIFLAVFNYSAISIAGVYASSTSGDLRVANNRVSRIAYPLGLMYVTYLVVLVTGDFLSTLVIGGACLFIYLCIILVYATKVMKMKQSDYFQNIKLKKSERVHKKHVSYVVPKSQFDIVLRFEWKYLMTLKSMLLNFGFLCFGPIAIVGLLLYFKGTLDLNYAVILTVLMIPRVPTNLIAYSIGGEKVYKTGESLLSTPLHIRPIFLAKCMIPILVSAIMITVSSLLTLVGVNILTIFMPDIASIHGYTVEQLILLFPISILSSITMMFISAILSVILKTPRHGLYVTSIISFLFVIPVLAIIYLTTNTLMWSVIYLVVLLICNVIVLMNISEKISRPQIMSRL